MNLCLVLRRPTYPPVRCSTGSQSRCHRVLQASVISAANLWVPVFGGFCGTTCSHVRPQIKGITTRTYMHVACGAQKQKEGNPKVSVGSCLWEVREGDEFRHKSVLS